MSRRKQSRSRGNTTKPVAAANSPPSEVPGTFPVTSEYLARQRAVLSDPDCPYPEIDHQGFGMEVCILDQILELLTASKAELEFNQIFDEDDPRATDWKPWLQDDPRSKLLWEKITEIIELNVTPFGRGMFAKGVVWASERTTAERKALLRYEAAQRRNAAKATAVRMAKTKARDARLLTRYRELARKMKRQTGIYLALADEFGLSEHRVSEIVRHASAGRKK
jgi:hypothetical protein